MTEDRRIHGDYQKYFATQYWQTQYFIRPGEFYCSNKNEEMLVAEAGSGVIVAMYDQGLRVGGLAHILMSREMARDFYQLSKCEDAHMKRTFRPLEEMICQLKEYGAGKERIQIRLSGGADIAQDYFDLALKNVVLVQSQIRKKGLNLMSKDIGGNYCRRIHFLPYRGRFERIPLRRKRDREDLWLREKEYLESLNKQVYS